MAVPAAPTRAGFTFAGWWSAATGGSQLTTTTALSTSTSHARWQAPEHPVTFDSVGGSAVAAIAVEEGSTFVLPTPPTKLNHTFAGWFTAVSGGTEWTSSTPVTAAMTLYARWTLNTYTVSFATGTGASAVPSQTIAHGGTAAVPSVAPTRTGHTFGGWVTTAGGSTVWDATAAVTSDITVYARWTVNTYTVTFDTGAGGSFEPSQTIDHGQAAAVPAGRSVTIFGEVSPATAIGTIELFQDGVSIGSGPAGDGKYQINTFALAGGTYVYTAVFTPGEARFLASTSTPLALVVNGLAPRVPAPAADTQGLFDEIEANGWPVHPLAGGVDSVLGKNVSWSNPLDSFVDVYVYSTAQWLGTYAIVGGRVDPSYWNFMPVLSPGPHHLVFVGQTTGDVSVYEFSVTAPPGAVVTGSPVVDGLPVTGSNPSPWASLGLLLLVLGLGMLVRRRRLLARG
ncbi:MULTISPECIES: InlB B-repeat-containing protein [unclassified Salinibacterium]|uniref:InlB B-repeat-containing protein n=1 Tax=Salinibacterium sp. dk5596 TaxID=2603291 RepID=UPI00143DC410